MRAEVFAFGRQTIDQWLRAQCGSLERGAGVLHRFFLGPVVGLWRWRLQGIFFGQQAANGELTDQLRGLFGASAPRPFSSCSPA